MRVGVRVRAHLGVEDLDGKGTAGDGEDRTLQEVGRVLLGVEGRGGADDLVRLGLGLWAEVGAGAGVWG